MSYWAVGAEWQLTQREQKSFNYRGNFSPWAPSKPTMRKNVGNAGDETKLVWFSQLGKIYSAWQGSVSGWSEAPFEAWRRISSKTVPASLNDTFDFFFFLLLDLCKEEHVNLLFTTARQLFMHSCDVLRDSYFICLCRKHMLCSGGWQTQL